uniref:Receptor-type tyrosine-protein phosphatase eta n=1 Tax=Schistocephalus solidus TaxID=70667 RepID=A0A0X3Q1B7_SCHSO
MSCIFLIVFVVHLTHGFNPTQNAEYTYKANVVSEAAQEMTLYWYGDKLIGQQDFEVRIRPADKESIITFDQFVKIKNLNPSKSYEFIVFLRKNGVFTPIAYTRGSVLRKGELPERPPEHSRKEETGYSHELVVVSDGPYKMLVQWKVIRQLATWNYRFELITTPSIVPPIITDEMSIEIRTLTPDTLYKFKLKIRFNDGTEENAAEEASGRTFHADSPMATNLHAMVVSSNRIDLHWTAAKTASLGTITYQVQCKSDDRISYDVTGTTVSFQNLLPMRAYVFQVRSKMVNGTFYNFAAHVDATTWSRDESNPSEAISKPISSTSVLISWTAPAELDDVSKTYKIVTNSDYKNAQDSYSTHIKIQNLSPSTDYVFTIFTQTTSGFWHMPGAKTRTKTSEEGSNNHIH